MNSTSYDTKKILKLVVVSQKMFPIHDFIYYSKKKNSTNINTKTHEVPWRETECEDYKKN